MHGHRIGILDAAVVYGDESPGNQGRISGGIGAVDAVNDRGSIQLLGNGASPDGVS